MANTMTQARLHEHMGRIALLLSDDSGEYGGPTLYLTPALAAKLSEALKTASVQVSNGYHFETVAINREA